jgi:hypothetical protein
MGFDYTRILGFFFSHTGLAKRLGRHVANPDVGMEMVAHQDER